MQKKICNTQKYQQRSRRIREIGGGRFGWRYLDSISSDPRPPGLRESEIKTVPK